jgi:hypothetical protein
MKNPLVGFLSSLSRATLDPALGGKGLALSRLLSLATFAAERSDEQAHALLEDLGARMHKALQLGDLPHEMWNDLQASAESGHWFLRASFPQRGLGGVIAGGHELSAPAEPAQDPVTAAIEATPSPATPVLPIAAQRASGAAAKG